MEDITTVLQNPKALFIAVGIVVALFLLGKTFDSLMIFLFSPGFDLPLSSNNNKYFFLHNKQQYSASLLLARVAMPFSSSAHVMPGKQPSSFN